MVVGIVVFGDESLTHQFLHDVLQVSWYCCISLFSCCKWYHNLTCPQIILQISCVSGSHDEAQSLHISGGFIELSTKWPVQREKAA